MARFVQFDRSSGVGSVFINPDQVGAVTILAGYVHDAEIHVVGSTAAVKGTPAEVAEKLGAVTTIVPTIKSGPETSAVLAGLRILQVFLEREDLDDKESCMDLGGHEQDAIRAALDEIYEEDPKERRLTVKQIDRLCEVINCS